jgi:hypothetical protein
MKKIIVDCPDEDKVIDLIIDAASEAGAGKIGNYSRCALITRGIGTWSVLTPSDWTQNVSLLVPIGLT